MSIASGYGPNWTTAESRGLDAQRRIAELEQQLAAAQAEARELRAEIESEEKRFNAQQDLLYRVINERDALQFELARVREIVSALSQTAEQHDPLAVSDHCPECSEPEPECVCGEQPAERESLPLMARRRWMPKAVRYCFRNRDCGWFFSLNTPTDGEWEFVFRIADTDEHGLPVVERTADMPEDVTHMTLHTRRFFRAGELRARSVEGDEGLLRIEDYRPAAQESGDA